MVKEAKKAGIPFNFVLFDTWFSNPAQLVELKSMDVDTIAMIKKNSTKYLWTDPETGNQSRLDVKEIYSRSKKRRGKSWKRTCCAGRSKPISNSQRAI